MKLKELRDHVFHALQSIIVRKECLQEEGSKSATSSSSSTTEPNAAASDTKPTPPISLPLIILALREEGRKICSRIETYDDSSLKDNMKASSGSSKEDEDLFYKVKAGPVISKDELQVID